MLGMARSAHKEDAMIALYGTAEAAEYVGLSQSGLRYYLYVKKSLVPHKKIGQSLIFTREQLDRFQETRRGPGRPRKETA